MFWQETGEEDFRTDLYLKGVHEVNGKISDNKRKITNKKNSLKLSNSRQNHPGKNLKEMGPDTKNTIQQ